MQVVASARQTVPVNTAGAVGFGEEVAQAVQRFVGWLDRAGSASFDPYDVWGTRYGVWARRLYYQRGWLGAPWVAPIVLMEMLAPGLRRLLVQKARYATADAQLVLAFLNLHRIGFARPPASVLRLPSSATWLGRACALAEELLAQSIPGYHGHCWGYPFDWQTNKGLWRKHTPFITCTPYGFEAFLALHEATGQARYLDIAASVARFVAEDLHETPTGPEAAAASYSPVDRSAVVNASAYRAFVLFEAAHRFGNDAFREKARRNLNFVLQSQRPDGSWLYATDNPAEAFIDHFHTCFVLKNLVKVNRRLNQEQVTHAVQHGYEFYRQALFDADGNPKPFAVRPRLQLVRLELYDVAEAITLGVLLRDQIPEAFDRACGLGRRLAKQWQLADGHFVTRVYWGGLRHRLPFVRWPQAQLFFALTNLLQALSPNQ